MAFTVKTALGQWPDAGFKISRAGGGLSPAKEDVIIWRTRIVMRLTGWIQQVVITRSGNVSLSERFFFCFLFFLLLFFLAFVCSEPGEKSFV